MADAAPAAFVTDNDNGTTNGSSGSSQLTQQTGGSSISALLGNHYSSGEDDDTDNNNNNSSQSVTEVDQPETPLKHMPSSNLTEYPESETKQSQSQQPSSIAAADSGATNKNSLGVAIPPTPIAQSAQQPDAVSESFRSKVAEAGLPMSPPGQPCQKVQRKVSDYLKRRDAGQVFNEHLRGMHSFKNPSILEKIVAKYAIHDHGTNYAPDKFNATIEDGINFTHLAKQQLKEEAERKAQTAQTIRQQVAFATGNVQRPSPAHPGIQPPAWQNTMASTVTGSIHANPALQAAQAAAVAASHAQQTRMAQMAALAGPGGFKPVQSVNAAASVAVAQAVARLKAQMLAGGGPPTQQDNSLKANPMAKGRVDGKYPPGVTIGRGRGRGLLGGPPPIKAAQPISAIQLQQQVSQQQALNLQSASMQAQLDAARRKAQELAHIAIRQKMGTGTTHAAAASSALPSMTATGPNPALRQQLAFAMQQAQLLKKRASDQAATAQHAKKPKL